LLAKAGRRLERKSGNVLAHELKSNEEDGGPEELDSAAER
jgi:hypothetical protein